MTPMQTLNGLKVESKRLQRAKNIPPSYTLCKTDAHEASVNGYDVRIPLDGSSPSCTCVDWKTHGLAENTACKHILALGLRAGLLQDEPGVVHPAANPTASLTFSEQVSRAISAAIQKLAEQILDIIEAGYVPLLVGPTGTGKTSAVRLVARHLGASLYEVSGAESYTDSDLVGVTMPTGMKFPGVIARAAENAQEGFVSLLFFDEFTRFSPRAAEGLLRLLLPISQQDAHRMGFAAEGTVRATSAPFWGDVWMPARDCPIVLACNPWGQPLDPALVRRTVPIWAEFDVAVAGLFEGAVQYAITTSWAASQKGELPLPIEYGEISQARDSRDSSLIERYRSRLKVLDPAADEAFGLMMKGIRS